jgi:hypothetical protein
MPANVRVLPSELGAVVVPWVSSEVGALDPGPAYG